MAPEPYLVFDIDMHDGRHLLETKEWLKRRPKDSKVVFVVDETSRSEKMQAHALGATDVIHRPIDGKALLTLLWGDFDSLAVDTADAPAQKRPGRRTGLRCPGKRLFLGMSRRAARYSKAPFSRRSACRLYRITRASRR